MRLRGVLDCAFASHLWFYHNVQAAHLLVLEFQTPFAFFKPNPKSSYQLEF
jgi:hypothetical protein